MSRVNSKPNSKVQSRAPSLPQSRVNSKPSSKVASKVASKVNSRANSDVNLKSRSKVNSAKQSTVELQKEVEQVVAVGAAEEPAIVAAPEQVQAEPNVPEQVATENEQEQRPPEEIQEPIQKHDSTVELNMLDPTILSEALQPLKFNALQEDDEQYTDFSVIPKTTRILTSPLPTEMDGFTFINVDYDMDPDLPVLTNTKLSRSNSWDYGIDKPVRKGVLEEYDVFLGVLRASTPVKEVEENVSVEVEPVIIDFIDREALISDIRQIIEQREKLLIKNQMFQNALGDHFKRKRTDETRDGEKSVSDQEKRYNSHMRTLIDLRNQNTIQQATLSKTVNEYRVKLQERLDEASEKSSEYCKTLRTSALNSENSRTGKPLAIKVVENLEAIQARKEAEVVSVRLENIKLRNKLKRDELLLRQKEELADGLHLIDFEQLKIENQTYNEKIEERNEDLLKLRKKITNVVQVLTHVKEKLHFVTNDNIELMGQLKELDMKVSHERDALPIEKRKREELRNGNTFIKQKNGLLGNVGLLKDFEDKVKSGEELQRQIDELREWHQKMAADTLVVKRRIEKSELLI